MEDPIVSIPKPLMVFVGLYAPLSSLKCFRDKPSYLLSSRKLQEEAGLKGRAPEE